MKKNITKYSSKKILFSPLVKKIKTIFGFLVITDEEIKKQIYIHHFDKTLDLYQIHNYLTNLLTSEYLKNKCPTKDKNILKKCELILKQYCSENSDTKINKENLTKLKIICKSKKTQWFEFVTNKIKNPIKNDLDFDNFDSENYKSKVSDGAVDACRLTEVVYRHIVREKNVNRIVKKYQVIPKENILMYMCLFIIDNFLNPQKMHPLILKDHIKKLNEFYKADCWKLGVSATDVYVRVMQELNKLRKILTSDKEEYKNLINEIEEVCKELDKKVYPILNDLTIDEYLYYDQGDGRRLVFLRPNNEY